MLIERIRRAIAAAPVAREAIVSQIIIRSVLIVLLMACLVAAFVWVAAQKSDALSIERQQHVIATVLEQNFRAIAHDQEAATVWDDSVREVRARTPDAQWLDDNLGVWFHSYYGHDEVFIVDARDRAVYAMRNGQRHDPAAYARSIGAAADPLIAELRAKTRNGVTVPKASS
ncbi:MAG: CHASE4 domain-containing protein, partial [Rhizorhabdus sp.]